MRLLLLFLYILSARAEEKPLDLTYRGHQNDLKAFMNHATSRLNLVSKPQFSNCKIDYDLSKSVDLEKNYDCFIVPEKSFKDWLIAEDDSIECSIQQNNDAALWKIRKEGQVKTKLSDDEGYTLGLKGKCARENKEKVWTTEIQSDYFTKKEKSGRGYKKSPDGKYYIHTYERIQVSSEVEVKNPESNLRPVARVALNYDTDKSDGLGSKVQQAWHNNLDRYENLRYAPLKGNYSELTAEAQVGLKAVYKADISNFRCSMSGTALVGADSKGNPLISSKVDAQIDSGSMGGREDAPLFLVYLVQKNEFRGQEKTSITEAEVGSYVWSNKETSVYFGIGRVVHRSEINTRYTSKEEPIHSVHFRVKKSFRGL